MAKVVAVDAGTTGVRALVVDEGARVADVAYRELTQHFPRPGWVEHDPDEIWAAVRATLAEVGARLAESGERAAAIGITNQRETLVAFDRSSGRPLHNGHRLAGPPYRADLRRAHRGRPPAARRATTGLVLDPYFSATKAAWLLRHGDLALGADDPNLSFCTVDTWVLWNLTGGATGGGRQAGPRRVRHRPVQRQPHVALRYAHAHLVRRAVRPLRGARAHAPRAAPLGGSLRHRRAGRPRPRRGRARRRRRSRGCWATSKLRSSARPASTRAWSRSPTAPAASCWPTPVPNARPRPMA